MLLKIFAFSYKPPESDDLFYRLRNSPREYMEQLAQGHLFQLSRACSMWRSVVAGAPSLWSTMYVNLANWKETHPSIVADLKHLLSAAVERSGNCPLQLTVRAAGYPCEAPGLELLAQCSERWQTANIWIDDEAFQHLSSAKRKFPLLKSLQIHGAPARPL